MKTAQELAGGDLRDLVNLVAEKIELPIGYMIHPCISSVLGNPDAFVTVDDTARGVTAPACFDRGELFRDIESLVAMLEARIKGAIQTCSDYDTD
jgi:hypothetical protein